MEWSEVFLWGGLVLLWGAAVAAILALLSASRSGDDAAEGSGGSRGKRVPTVTGPATVIGRYGRGLD